MAGILYEENTVMALVLVILGCWAAWMTGRAMASSWSSPVQLVVYTLLLALGMRFLHFALFEATLLSLRFYMTDAVILLVFALVSYRFTRTRQMVQQYYWLYERTGPLTWTKRCSAP